MGIDNMSDRELIELAHSLFDAIYKSDSYNPRDLAQFYAILDILARHGYKIHVTNRLIIK